VVSADYEKRNYANDANQYVDVLYNLNNFNRYFYFFFAYSFLSCAMIHNIYSSHITCKCPFYRPFLLRDVYDDMILDGIQPISDTFAPLFVGCMKGSRLQDAFYFYEEMKSMGYIPDVSM
jgi:pentatricopeptide repeat protein